ncbi:hypothetical protein [Oceanobacillus sp. J11TS1]|uniref:hypothetical protein n=1 Tax=Oceanobacillus sp. J11TS1 TaxID=2807191 RepID=UPI001B2B643E|nr:hypothetical protein [Oceanobacillus sp. J11TS1]GIO25382.1 hypothetical protein J11TS1_39630 [Oceanobacillus sp. J11TS1]
MNLRRTEQNLMLAVIKRNLEKGYVTEDQTRWLVQELQKMQDQLERQINHEEYLLEELQKRGWPEGIF